MEKIEIIGFNLNILYKIEKELFYFLNFILLLKYI
jgi:hypothetical protein